MSLIEGGDMVRKKGEAREISKEQGDLAAHWTEEGKENPGGTISLALEAWKAGGDGGPVEG